MQRHLGPGPLRNGNGRSAAATRCRGALGKLGRDKRGVVAVIAAVAAPCFLGVAGLTVEVGGWYVLRRNMQAAADAAAMAGALSFESDPSASAALAVAQSVTSRNGFVHNVKGTTVTITPNATTRKVEVQLQRPSSAFLLKAVRFGDYTETVMARSVGEVVDGGAPPCVLALKGSVSVGNNTDITAGNCALASNSAAADAFKVGSGGSVANGSGRIATANLVTHGGCEGCVAALDSSKITLTKSPSPNSYAPKTGNDYEGLSNWSAPAWVSNIACVNQPPRPTLLPGCYNSISSKNNSPVNLSPGIYYIRGGNLDVQGALTCTTCNIVAKTGVSIVLLAGNNGTVGNVDVNSSANINLNAGVQLLDSRLNGVLIYRHAPNAVPNQNGKGEIDINGGANMKLNGAIVAPTSWVTMSGNGQTDDSTCNIFVAHSMEFRGNSYLSAKGCDLYGTKTNKPRIARVVE